MLVFESVLHGVRLLLELGLSDTEPRDVELAVFEFFFVAGALRGARFFVRGLAVWWQNLLPTLALALHAVVSRVYELVSLTLLAASFVSAPTSASGSASSRTRSRSCSRCAPPPTCCA